MSPLPSEYDRLLSAARRAFDEGRTAEFEITGEALRIAREQDASLEKIRRFFLAEVLRQYINELRG
ncbi:hypothetical protein [Streptosporangium sp. NPDC006007]|uniref:hypothetical protein n=1 Tax=Streptosporangium sp. NPDC006007 TaxID=3154575 RepID=UPI0033BD9BEA